MVFVWAMVAYVESPAGKLPRGSGAAPVKTGGGNRALGVGTVAQTTNFTANKHPMPTLL